MLNSEAVLISGLEKLGFKNKEFLLSKLLIYMNLLFKWNKVFNLISIKRKEEIVTHHFLDCLAIIPYIKGENILDVGSGAGLPGIIIGICYPDKKITLVESVGKKTAFLKQICLELNLENIKVIHNRVEKVKTDRLFDSIIARAFAEMQILIDLTSHLIVQNGNWYGMKSKKMRKEKISSHYNVERRLLSVPYLDAERYLVKINKR